MRPLGEIMDGVRSHEDARDAVRQLEYSYPFVVEGSPEQAIALRAFQLLDSILNQPDND